MSQAITSARSSNEALLAAMAERLKEMGVRKAVLILDDPELYLEVDPE